MTGVWVPHDTRDQIVDFVRRWSGKTVIEADEIAECLPDEWSVVEAWDES